MASVQFNLLPDLKMQYVKAQRNKSLIASISILVSAIALGIFILLFLSVNVVQKKMLSDADGDIKKYTNDLKAIPRVEETLTVQNQLKSLPELHQKKHITSRLFTYLPQLMPANVNISTLNLDLTGSLMTIEGTADSQVSVNTFIDTLKFTKYKTDEQGQETTAFPSVTESSFSINPGNVSYGLNITFDPNLFANSPPGDNGRVPSPTLIVPKLTSTHAVSGNPLFKTEVKPQ